MRRSRSSSPSADLHKRRRSQYSSNMWSSSSPPTSHETIILNTTTTTSRNSYSTPSPRSTSPPSPSSTNAEGDDEDWTKISDTHMRRRIQNRIAQRKYRERLKTRQRDLEARVLTLCRSQPAPPPQIRHPFPAALLNTSPPTTTYPGPYYRLPAARDLPYQETLTGNILPTPVPVYYYPRKYSLSTESPQNGGYYLHTQPQLLSGPTSRGSSSAGETEEHAIGEPHYLQQQPELVASNSRSSTSSGGEVGEELLWPWRADIGAGGEAETLGQGIGKGYYLPEMDAMPQHGELDHGLDGVFQWDR